MITKFSVLYVGTDRAGERGPAGDARQRAALLERAAGRGLPHRQGRRPAHGRARLLLPVDGRASLPARGLRGVPEPHPPRHVAGHPDQAAQVRLRVQRPADVAPDPPGRGLRRRRHHDRTAASSWGSGAAITRARSRASARRCSTTRRTRSCSRSRWRCSSRPSTRSRSRTTASTTRSRRRCEYRGYTLSEVTLVPRPIHRPVEIWQPIASGKTLPYIAQRGIKGMVTLNGEKIFDQVARTYQAEAAKAGRQLALGEDLCWGVGLYLADTAGGGHPARRAVPRRALQVVRALRLRALRRRGGAPWGTPGAPARIPSIRDGVEQKAWLCGPPQARDRGDPPLRAHAIPASTR